jgi:hypothetical protein
LWCCWRYWLVSGFRFAKAAQPGRTTKNRGLTWAVRVFPFF